MRPWCSRTPLAAAELGQGLLDASRVAVDHPVQAEDSRTARGWGRQRKPCGALLGRAAEENRPAPVFSTRLPFPSSTLSASKKFCVQMQSAREWGWVVPAVSQLLQAEDILVPNSPRSPNPTTPTQTSPQVSSPQFLKLKNTF